MFLALRVKKVAKVLLALRIAHVLAVVPCRECAIKPRAGVKVDDTVFACAFLGSNAVIIHYNTCRMVDKVLGIVRRFNPRFAEIDCVNDVVCVRFNVNE